MKRFIGIAALSGLFILIGQHTTAQTLKFGHINRNELIQAMPEFETANTEIEKFRQELINVLELMTVELNNKSDAYTKESKSLTDLVRQTKEQELFDMNKRIQEFQGNAQEQLQNKQVELFQPVTAKADKAIKDVGKEIGLIYVFDTSSGQLVYFDEAKSTNILTLAKAKLGLK